MQQNIEIGVVSSYLPRRCGIATFSASLLNAVNSVEGKAPFVVAVAPMSERIEYERPVSLVMSQEEHGDYRRAAEHLNSRADVVVLQHEFGLFGGADGEFILDLVDRLDRPLITTFHTVLAEPTPNQRRIVSELCRASSAVAVMTEHTRRVLLESYSAAGTPIEVIPHGVPVVDDVARRSRATALYPGRQLVLSAGLLGPGKGFEVVIEALPLVVGEHPETLYLMVGATHPEVRRREGEAYRGALMALAAKLGVERHVAFLDEFVTEPKLVEHLLRADVFVTPHESREQSSSGTLTYAMAAGNAIISTPYPYAREMLAGGAGLLVDHGDVRGMARALSAILVSPALKEELRVKTFGRSRRMVWPAVAEQYLALAARVADQSGTPAVHQRPTPSVLTPEHLYRLTDGTGVLQHAIGAIPDRGHGYCTDDNARALQFAVGEMALQPGRRLSRLFETTFAFVLHAFNEKAGRFRNFMAFDRQWLDEAGTPDTQGRAIESLAHVAAANVGGGYQVAAMTRLLQALESDPFDGEYARPIAYAAIGLHAYLAAHPHDGTIAAHQRRLATLMRPHATPRSAAWQWSEAMLTYENGRIPEALIALGRDTKDEAMIRAGIAQAEWLFRTQMAATGTHLSIVGNQGWHHESGERAPFDQQPVEIAGLVGVALQAWAVTGERAWLAKAELANAWYFGANDLGVSVYEPATGGCYDGLQSRGVNRNQGAESVLSLLVSRQALASVSALRAGSRSTMAGPSQPHRTLLEELPALGA